MPAATRLGDESTGHGAYPPTPSIEASGDVFINGQGAVRVGDAYAPHASPDSPPHSRALASGSSKVFINGQPAGRIGDDIDCGDAVAQASPNVFIGDSEASIEIIDGIFIPENPYVFRHARPLVTNTGTNAVLDEPIEEELKADLVGYPDEEPATEPVEDFDPNDQTKSQTIEGCPTVSSPINYDMMISNNTRLRDVSIGAVFPHNIRPQVGLSVDDIVCNLSALAQNVIDPIRARFPSLNINSGFRVGTGGSQHNRGQAVDFQRPGGTAAFYREVLNFIASEIPYDQCIIETSNGGRSYWIHVSFNRNLTSQRAQRLTYIAGRSPAYTSGWGLVGA